MNPVRNALKQQKDKCRKTHRFIHRVEELLANLQGLFVANGLYARLIGSYAVSRLSNSKGLSDLVCDVDVIVHITSIDYFYWFCRLICANPHVLSDRRDILASIGYDQGLVQLVVSLDGHDLLTVVPALFVTSGLACGVNMYPLDTYCMQMEHLMRLQGVKALKMSADHPAELKFAEWVAKLIRRAETLKRVAKSPRFDPLLRLINTAAPSGQWQAAASKWLEENLSASTDQLNISMVLTDDPTFTRLTTALAAQMAVPAIAQMPAPAMALAPAPASVQSDLQSIIDRLAALESQVPTKESAKPVEAELGTRLSAALEIIAQRDAELKGAQLELAVIECKWNAAVKDLRVLKSELAAATKESAALNAKLTAATTQSADFKSKLTAETTQSADFKSKFAAATKELADFKAKLTAVTKELADSKAKLTAATTQSADFKSKFAAATTQSAALNAKLTAATTQSADLEAKLAAATTQSADFKSKFAAATTQSAALNAKLTAATTQSADFKAKLVATTKELADSKATLAAATTQSADFKAKLDAATTQSADFKAKLDALQKVNNAMETVKKQCEEAKAEGERIRKQQKLASELLTLLNGEKGALEVKLKQSQLKANAYVEQLERSKLEANAYADKLERQYAKHVERLDQENLQRSAAMEAGFMLEVERQVAARLAQKSATSSEPRNPHNG